MSQKKHHLSSQTLFDPSTVNSAAVLGVDVSKLTLDICLLAGGKTRQQSFANTSEGIAQLLAMLQRSGAGQALVTMEATGPYSLALATAAFAAGHPVAVINPRRVLDYARACERRNKTDRADAALLARFASKESLPRWRPLPEDQAVLRELVRRQSDLEAHLHAEERRLEMAPTTPALRRSLQRSTTWLRAELARLEKSLAQHLAAHHALASDVEHLQSIPGFGKKSARWAAAEIPRHFANARAASAWLRVVPQQWTSGSSVRKPSLIGRGAPCLRRKLYFAAVTALRCDPRCQAFAERLRASGHSKMSILFAVLHKLIRTAFAILKTNTPYQPNHTVTLRQPCSP
jgi:transposase